MIHKLNLYSAYAFLLTILFSANLAGEIPFTMKLKPCPYSPNCVSSQSDSAFSRVSPLSYNLSETQAMEKIKKIILGLPRTKLVKEADKYLHIEFRSAVFGFIDDVEIIINDTEKVIHFRSASRVGFWDLGANKRRVNEIKKKFRD